MSTQNPSTTSSLPLELHRYYYHPSSRTYFFPVEAVKVKSRDAPERLTGLHTVYHTIEDQVLTSCGTRFIPFDDSFHKEDYTLVPKISLPSALWPSKPSSENTTPSRSTIAKFLSAEGIAPAPSGEIARAFEKIKGLERFTAQEVRPRLILNESS